MKQLRAQLGNHIAIRAFREGKLPFPDGTIIAALHWNEASSLSIGLPAASPTQNWTCNLHLKKEAWDPSAHRHRPHSAYCVEETVCFAAELGYEVTVLKDATASYSDREMHAALEVNIPNYASAIVSTKEVVKSISSL